MTRIGAVNDPALDVPLPAATRLLALGFHGQSNGFGHGRLFDVKSQERLTSKLPCRGDMKQVSTAAPDGLVMKLESA